MSANNNNNKYSNMDILDIVFEGRNKAYGAYDLRKVYPKHLRNSLIATVLGILFLVAIPYVKALVTPLLENNKEKSRDRKSTRLNSSH